MSATAVFLPCMESTRDLLLGLDYRLNRLLSAHFASAYEKRKFGLERDLDDFLRTHCRSGIMDASPRDLCRFLVWKDKGGKTAVHDVTCSCIGNRGPAVCKCPRRLAAGTVRSLIGQMRAIFNGRVGNTPWDVMSNTGNPARSGEVTVYLKAIQAEQARAHVVPKQAVPLFGDKLCRVASYIDRQLEKVDLTLIQRFVLLRDQAFFTARTKLHTCMRDRESECFIHERTSC